MSAHQALSSSSSSDEESTDDASNPWKRIQDYSTLTVSELKKILKGRPGFLSASGKKSSLIKRLEDDDEDRRNRREKRGEPNLFAIDYKDGADTSSEWKNMDSWAKLAWTNMDNGQQDECKAYIVEVFNEGSTAHLAFLDQISMVEVGACTPQEAYEDLSKFFDGKENLMSLLKVILGLKRHTQDGSTNKEDLRKSPAEGDEPAKGNDHTQDGSTQGGSTKDPTQDGSTSKEDLRKSPAETPDTSKANDHTEDGSTNKEDLRKSPAEGDEPAKGNDHTEDGSTNKEDLRKSPAEGDDPAKGNDHTEDGSTNKE